ncbi:hypothetical protein Patl1_22361 [Pistacia atlantica]|uniref:Uncharacterized protein n=1 Tax=Pistacia atlantica TaxID=434234 RepID=A0ACC0ZZE5_9ROSI|nr:hypothetical protein Patl1_22361 [Pistacia atlantica]
MDIEGNRRGSRRRRDMIRRDVSCLSNDLFSSIYSLVCLFFSLNISYNLSLSKLLQVYLLLCKHKKRALAVVFVLLETISLVVDVFGQSSRSILLAAFLLSAFGFVLTILSCMLERTRVHAEKQLGVVEISFSVVQLIATFLAVLGIKINNNYTTQVLLLIFAIIAAVFIFRKDENILGSLRPTNENENELQENENESELQLMEVWM